MAEITETGDSYDYLETTHLTGDLHYVSKYGKMWWYTAAALTLLVPPAGVFLAVFLFANSIVTDPTEAELRIEA